MQILGYVYLKWTHTTENAKYTIKLRESGRRVRYKVYMKNLDDHSRWKGEHILTGYWYKSNIPLLNHITEEIQKEEEADMD